MAVTVFLQPVELLLFVVLIAVWTTPLPNEAPPKPHPLNAGAARTDSTVVPQTKPADTEPQQPAADPQEGVDEGEQGEEEEEEEGRQQHQSTITVQSNDHRRYGFVANSIPPVEMLKLQKTLRVPKKPLDPNKVFAPAINLIAFMYSPHVVLVDMTGAILSGLRLPPVSALIAPKWVNSSTICGILRQYDSFYGGTIRETNPYFYNWKTGEDRLIRVPQDSGFLHSAIQYNPHTHTLLTLRHYITANPLTIESKQTTTNEVSSTRRESKTDVNAEEWVKVLFFPVGSDNVTVGSGLESLVLPVLYDELVEIEVETGAVVWSWNSEDAYPYDRNSLSMHAKHPYSDCAAWGLRYCVSWSGVNSLVWDVQRQFVYLNMNNLNKFVKLSKPEKQILWEIGDGNSMQFQLFDYDNTLLSTAVLNNTLQWWHSSSGWQLLPASDDSEKFLFLDNDYENENYPRKEKGGRAVIHSAEVRSRVVEINVFPSQHRVHIEWVYQPPFGKYTHKFGSVGRLPNNNTVVSLTYTHSLLEVRPSKFVSWELLTHPRKKMEGVINPFRMNNIERSLQTPWIDSNSFVVIHHHTSIQLFVKIFSYANLGHSTAATVSFWYTTKTEPQQITGWTSRLLLKPNWEGTTLNVTLRDAVHTTLCYGGGGPTLVLRCEMNFESEIHTNITIPTKLLCK